MKKTTSVKFLVLAAALGLQVFYPVGTSLAVSTNMGATATFLSAITLTPTPMNFGKILFGGAPTSADTVTLTTAGAVSFAGSNFSSGGGTVAAGDVAITGTAANVLTVDCSTSGTLAQSPGAGRIAINSIKVANLSAAAGGGVACNGIGNSVLTFTLNPGTDDHLRVGGKIDGATTTSFAAGSYDTGASGGANIIVNISYQ